jgi:2-polyprenyl-6-methoxyphenol hydroxylase-like FAD-dependent oxidoreductase
MSEDGVEDCDVIICGCGPTGALLSALLGRLQVKHVVLERELDITTDPRGIVLDEDGIRIAQGVGIYKDLFEDVGSGKTTSLPPEKAWRSTKSGSDIWHSDEHV